jgi:hypothetical protein
MIWWLRSLVWHIHHKAAERDQKFMLFFAPKGFGELVSHQQESVHCRIEKKAHTRSSRQEYLLLSTVQLSKLQDEWHEQSHEQLGQRKKVRKRKLATYGNEVYIAEWSSRAAVESVLSMLTESGFDKNSEGRWRWLAPLYHQIRPVVRKIPRWRYV